MFLGLDLGTTNVKVLVVDRDGSIAAEGSAPVTRTTTPDGGVEQDINQIWNATCEAIRQAVRQMPGRNIQAVGVSSQGGAVQLLSAQNESVGPVISWLDTRGKPFDRQLEEEMGVEYADMESLLRESDCVTLHTILSPETYHLIGEQELKLPDDYQPHVVGAHAQMLESHVFEDMMQLVDWVRDGRPSIANAEHARHVIDIIASGYRAAETGQTQELRTSFEPLPLDALGGQ